MRNFNRKIGFLNEIIKEMKIYLQDTAIPTILSENEIGLKLIDFNADTFGKAVYAVIIRKKNEGFDKQFLTINSYEIAKETLQKYISKFHLKDLTNFTMYAKKTELDLFQESKNNKDNKVIREVLDDEYNFILRNFIYFLKPEFILEIEKVYNDVLNKIFVNENQITGKKIVLKPKTSETSMFSKKIPFSVKVLMRKEFLLREELAMLQVKEDLKREGLNEIN